MNLIEPHDARAWAKRYGMNEAELRSETLRQEPRPDWRLVLRTM